jgi:hypothetical protein
MFLITFLASEKLFLEIREEPDIPFLPVLLFPGTSDAVEGSYLDRLLADCFLTGSLDHFAELTLAIGKQRYFHSSGA